MSGDSLDPSDYDEVRAMREYAIDCGSLKAQSYLTNSG